jgi:ribonuclease J
VSKKKLRIIPLGGLGEIGKNMMAIEYADDIIVIDAGLMFPEEEMLGIDLVIPDVTYLLSKQEKIRGLVITHGHEDHIGALPYVLNELNMPIYATKLTLGLVSVKLKERGGNIRKKVALNTIQVGTSFTLGAFEIEAFSVCHSIPDSIGLIIRTPVGNIVHSGDFKIDYTPVDGKPSDLSRLAHVGAEGVLLLLADSTYADLPGYTLSESVVGETLGHIISEAPGRVIIATFASLISRIQQIIDAAAKYHRYVFIQGRSMKDTVRMALDLGYLKAPADILRRSDEMNRFRPDQIILLTTGSQGEPTSALVRITNGDNSQIRITPGDTVIISATPIPGNESLINRTIDNLFRQGAHVIYSRISQVHVHGHASQEELKLLFNLVKPDYFVPIHGEYRHLSHHAKLAEEIGIPPQNIFILENGDILELSKEKAEIKGSVPADNVFVDGLVLGTQAGIVLRDRKLLSRDGIVVAIIAVDKKKGTLVGRPDLISRGFVDTTNGSSILEDARDLIVTTLSHSGKYPIERSSVHTKVKDTLGKFLYEHTKRRPMIITTIIEV